MFSFVRSRNTIFQANRKRGGDGAPSPRWSDPYRCWSVSYVRYLIAFWAPFADSEFMSPIVSRLSLYRFA